MKVCRHHVTTVLGLCTTILTVAVGVVRCRGISRSAINARKIGTIIMIIKKCFCFPLLWRRRNGSYCKALSRAFTAAIHNWLVKSIQLIRLFIAWAVNFLGVQSCRRTFHWQHFVQFAFLLNLVYFEIQYKIFITWEVLHSTGKTQFSTPTKLVSSPVQFLWITNLGIPQE